MNSAKEIYYNQLYEINNKLLSADRDFYQAVLAEAELYHQRSSLRVKEVESLVEEYDTNAQQTQDNVNAVEDIVKKDGYLYNSFQYGDAKSTMSDLIQEFRDSYEIWEGLYNPATDEGNYKAKDGKFTNTREHLNTMQDLMVEYAEYQEANLHQQLIQSIIGTVGVIFVIVVLCGIFVIYISRYISKGIKNTTERIDTLAQNDLTYTGGVTNSRDEIGTLSRAAHTVQAALLNIVKVLQNSSSELSVSAETMENSTSETSQSMRNISLAVSELATTATQQAEDVEQIAENMQDLNTVMEQSVRSAVSLNDTSEQIDQLTSDGKMTVETLTQVTKQCKEAFDTIFDVIVGIENSTQKISEASDLISSIATETNLLSLNASIEAARAGEAGRGFAVVADQIRQLSQQSADSVETINSMLEELQSNSDRAATQSSLVKQYVGKQSESVTQTKNSFDKIITSIEHVNVEVSQLEDVNKHLESGFMHIMELVSSLSAASQENAATAEELNATTEVVTDTVEHLHEIGVSINGSAEELSQVIGKFKV